MLLAAFDPYSCCMRNGDLQDSDWESLRRLAERVARRADSPDPEDVAQEIMLKLSRQEEMPDNLAAWVTRVTGNQVKDDAGKRARRPKFADEAGGHARDNYEFLVNGVPTSAAGMQEAAYQWLRDRLGEVFTDRELQLLSLASVNTPQAEIARIMGYKDATVVKATLTRVKSKADALDRGRLMEMLEHPRVY